MDGLAKIDRDELVRRMRQDFEQTLRAVADAVNDAPDGHLIDGSEERVRDLLGDFRTRSFHDGLRSFRAWPRRPFLEAGQSVGRCRWEAHAAQQAMLGVSPGTGRSPERVTTMTGRGGHGPEHDRGGGGLTVAGGPCGPFGGMAARRRRGQGIKEARHERCVHGGLS